MLVSGEGGQRARTDRPHPARERCSASIGRDRRIRPLAATTKPEITARLAALAADGSHPPVIERTWPLAEAREALAHVDAGHTVGKVVVVIAAGRPRVREWVPACLSRTLPPRRFLSERGESKGRLAPGQRPPPLPEEHTCPRRTPPTPSTSARPCTRTQHRRRYLMCRPEHFTVSYTINPWMVPANPTDTALAVRQWQDLYDTYIELGHEVELIDPVDGLPDMVYTANGGFLIDGIAYGPKFRFQERAGEEGPFIEWFRANGFDTRVPAEVNEGEGDFLLVGDTILAGTGLPLHRRQPPRDRRGLRPRGRHAHADRPPVLPPRHRHRGARPGRGRRRTAAPSAPTSPTCPAAFDAASQAILAERYPDAIHVSDEDGAVFGLNSSSDGRNVIISPRAKGFERQLRERGYNPVLVDLSELLLGGGGIKCCTLELRGASS